jgi:internalin A
MNTNNKLAEKIQECIQQKAKRLDIGQCGLTEIPSEIWEMDWLEELILGNNPTVPGDYDFLEIDEQIYSRIFPEKDKMTLNAGEPNFFNEKEGFLLSRLPNLQYLNICRVGSAFLIEMNSLKKLTILVAGENKFLSFPTNSSRQKSGDGFNKNEIEVLDFGRCERTDYRWIFNSSNALSLRFLNLSNFKADDYIFLTDLPNLVSLNLSSCTPFNSKKGTDPEFLRNNSKLKFLRMDNSSLSDSLAFNKLTELVYLDISHNEIELLSHLVSLIHLKSLFIEKNRVTDISPIASMQSLEKLYCGGNQLRSISPLIDLRHIREFDADDNNITDLKPMSKWQELEQVSVCNNQVSDLSPLLSLPSLKVIKLTDNDITSNQQVHQVVNLPNLTILKLFGNTIENLATTLLGRDSSVNCLLALKSHFASLASGHDKNSEIKLILVGNSTAGKTTLRKLLQDKDYNSREDSTHGIVMETWKLKKKDLEKFIDKEDLKVEELQINIWDFGGQEFYHETHKLFFSDNAVYILIWEEETNKHFIKDTKVFEPKENGTSEEVTKYIEHQSYEYWLKNIRHFSGSCPIIIVQNKIDKYLEPKPAPANEAKTPTAEKPRPVRIKRVDNNVLDSYNVNQSFDLSLRMYSQNKTDYVFEYNKFERYAVRTMAETIAGFSISNSYIAIKKLIEERRKKVNMLNYDEYLKMCLQVDPSLVDKMEGASKFLTDTSTILYYPRHPQLSQKVFINPIWVSETIYKILDKDVLERSGEFSYEHVEKKIGSFTDTFLELMKEFQLIFRKETKDNTEKKYVAPQFLPEGAATRSYTIFKSQCIEPRLVIRFPQFLPKTFMNGVLSRFANRSIDKSYYRYGVAFESEWITGAGEENVNIIECDFDKSEVSVFSKSANPYNLREIFEELLTVYTGFRNSAPSEQESQRTITGVFDIVARSKSPIHISVDNRNFVSWNELYERHNNIGDNILPLNDDSILLPVEGGSVIAALFNPFYTNKKSGLMTSISKLPEPPKLFISYSHKDEIYKDELLEHLSGMQRNGEIKNWTDRAILPGEKWDDVIKKSLEESNIVLFLVSSSFIASDYIQNVEIKKAIEKHNRNEIVIVPIPVRPFDYRSLPLKNIQSASKDFKPISTGYSTHDEGWTQVVTNLRLTIDDWKQRNNGVQ